MWELGNIWLIRTGNFRRVQEGEQNRGRGRREGGRGRGSVEQSWEVLFLLIDSSFVGQEHEGEAVAAVVCFDLTNEYGTEDEGEGHYY